MKSGTQTKRLSCLVLCLIATLVSRAAAQTSGAKASRRPDVIDGRTFGVALTMEVFTAATRNGSVDPTFQFHDLDAKGGARGRSREART